MKLPKDCNSRRGVSLIEITLVMAIFALLISVSAPMALSFYRSRQLDAQEKGIVQALRRAQSKSMAMERDSSFGVRISNQEKRYILFKGFSFANRDPDLDEEFDLPGDLEISGLEEIVFSRLEGNPSDTGDITLTLFGRSENININQLGRINY